MIESMAVKQHDSLQFHFPLTAVVSNLNDFVEGNDFIPKRLSGISSAQLHDVIQNFRLKKENLYFPKNTAIVQLEC
jgi:hypothetical protein